MDNIADRRRQFRPGLVPTLITLALMPLLVGLGLWQLGRAAYKEELEAAYAETADAPLAAAAVTDPEAMRFRPVTVRGNYDSGRQFLVDNMVRDGRNGFYVITPFRLTSGELLLVNRGWIPQNARRQPIGDLELAGDTRRIEGRVGRLPVAGIDLAGAEAAATGDWPSIRQFPDLAELSGALGEPVAPWVLLLSPAADDGYLRDWQPGGLPASRHVGYAVQWFALAAALAVIFVVVNFRHRHADVNE